MAFTVELRPEAHSDRPLKTLDVVVLPLGKIEERKWQFPLLRGIDPYSDTYFGQLQMRDLADELTELAADIEGEPRDSLERLIQLAEIGSSKPDHYLVFIGD